MLNNLPKITTKGKKRVGRGYGSGKGGHTVGRGQKGQKTRSKVGQFFEGTKTKKSLIQRLPLMRGKGKMKAKRPPIAIDLARLESLESGAKVDVRLLVKMGIVSSHGIKRGVKIIGNSKLSKKFVIQVPTSAAARKSIEVVGGSVEVQG